MEDTEINPISGEQVPYQDIQTGAKAPIQPVAQQLSTGEQTPQPANPKEFVIEKKMMNLKRSVIILGSILVMLLIALVSVLALLAQKPQVVGDNQVIATPTPLATPTGNENIPKEVVERVRLMEDKVKKLDIEENELAYPKLDWQIKF